MDAVQAVSLALGAGWASGLNLYASVFVLGALHAAGLAFLPPEMRVLAEPLVLWVAGGMYLLEFFADKIPGLDSAWDGLHTFVRIPAGAVLAAQAVGHIHPSVAVAAGLLGGGLAAGTHFTKAGTRLIANTSPEPVSNWFLSLSEDVFVIAGLWTALNYPVVFLVLLIFFVGVMAAALPVLWRTISGALNWIRGRFGGGRPPAPALSLPQEP